ncbi:WAS/WASL-interacting protein family member 2-like isoform X2 [Pomacea canaliculata]|uniref:WAS/WASL-interacting protein family member 2-like isoform X2 n=1 Tax=Pomacea canaliculata TaxID=400727 RepID=UPI000D73CAD6|nr:WAS/WASL-interacting protein family member 2-like isoform X2 [Pomacea canaliculata]
MPIPTTAIRENTHLTMNVGSAAPPPPLPPRPNVMPELPRLPPTGNRRKSSTPEHPPEPPRRVSSLSTTSIDDFEARFQFHSEATFPQPEAFSNGKKTYSSVVAKTQTIKPSSPPPPQPPPRPPPR